MTLRVAALTLGWRTPSSRFRVRQHIEPLGDYGISVREFRPLLGDAADLLLSPLRGKGVRIRNFPPVYPLYVGLLSLRLVARLPGILASFRYDVTWLQKGLCPGWPTLETQLHKPLVLDVDDAVWLAQPFGLKQMQRAAQRADVVVVCNCYLAQWFSQFCKRIEIVPTPVDGKIFAPARKSEDSPFIVGWTGMSSNYRYIEDIKGALRRFLRHAPDARLRVVADAPPPDWGLPAESVEFVRWTETNEAAAVQSMDVGIMPLADNEWTRGKCGFKAIQYMACGVPVVASPVGVNVDLLGDNNVGLTARTEAEWFDALVLLYEQRDEAKRIGTRGRARFLERYSRAAATQQLARIFKALQ